MTQPVWKKRYTPNTGESGKALSSRGWDLTGETWLTPDRTLQKQGLVQIELAHLPTMGRHILGPLCMWRPLSEMAFFWALLSQSPVMYPIRPHLGVISLFQCLSYFLPPATVAEHLRTTGRKEESQVPPLFTRIARPTPRGHA